MLELTSAELHSRLRRGFDGGQIQYIAGTLDQATGSKQMMSVPDDKVFLITQIAVQSETLTASGAVPASPHVGGVVGFEMNASPGTTDNLVGFLAFRRQQQLFEFQDSPNWRNAPPGNFVRWKPKYPICVPPSWTVESGTTGGDYGNQQVAYGYLIDTNVAIQLGFSVNKTATAADRRYAVTGTVPTASFADVLAGRTGQCIRVLDIHIRMQPETNTANVLTIRQSTDNRVIFRCANDNPSDHLELSFSPDWFLTAGADLEIATTVANTASVVMSVEFIPENECPANAWWCSQAPELATPGLGTSGALFGNITRASSELTLYFPRSDTTRTAPADDHQYFLRGYAFSLQKDTTTTPDRTSFCLSSGATAGTVEIQTLDSGSPQGNVQLTPTFNVVGHNQNLYGAVDDINVPGEVDGSLWVDSMGLGPTGINTPSTTDLDTSAWFVNAWGIMLPKKKRNVVNQGT